MSLLNSLNIGRSGLTAAQIGISVAGENIANAATEGYSRQRVEMIPAPEKDLGYAFVGQGVQISLIRRMVDESVETALRSSASDLNQLSRERDALRRIEDILNATSAVENSFDASGSSRGTDIGSKIDSFFDAIEELSMSPSDPAIRTTVVETGKALTNAFSSTAEDLIEYRDQLNSQVVQDVRDVNALLEQVAEYNQRILEAENGGTDIGEANGLRDRRTQLLTELSRKIEVNVVNAGNSTVNVYAGGETLVFGDDFFRLDLRQTNDGINSIDHVEFESTGSAVDIKGGSLAGLISARDEFLPEVLRDLDQLAGRLSFEFNKIHSEGHGIEFFSSIESVYGVHGTQLEGNPLSTPGTIDGRSGTTYLQSSSLAGLGLDVINEKGLATPFVGVNILFTSGANAGQIRTVTGFNSATGQVSFDHELPFELKKGDAFEVTSFNQPIKNGRFEITVHNNNTGDDTSVIVDVDRDALKGSNVDFTLEDLVGEINSKIDSAFVDLAGDGTRPLAATISHGNHLKLDTVSDDYSFRFGKDTSDLLAAMGLNTFFTGSRALDLGMNENLLDNANYVATGLSGSEGDNTNISGLASLRDAKIFSNGNEKVGEFFIGVISTVAVRSAESNDLVENQEVLGGQLRAERERISGVNVDEEAISLITFQRMFQASARFIAIVDQMMALLMNSI
ncbi:MAG: flagellar hook-associated protein FlgK [Planctomycetes bacterium]|nr:flagellar hook-associated protein FlgK [Planctomycetota bacterium]